MVKFPIENGNFKNPTVRDFEVFALLALGGTLSALAFSLLLTNWQIVEITTNQWACILYLGIVASGIGFYLWNKGAALCNAGTLAAFNNALIPVAVLSSLFIFGEIKEASLQNVLRLGIGTLFVTSAIVYGMRSVANAPSDDTVTEVLELAGQALRTFHEFTCQAPNGILAMRLGPQSQTSDSLILLDNL